MSRNTIIPYNRVLRLRARELRKNSTLGEVKLWKHIKDRALGWQFHRQVPMDAFIVDFYCHELCIAIEVDGSSHDNKQDYDQNRQARLESLGVLFARFSDDDVRMNVVGVVNEITRVVEKREKELGIEHPLGGNVERDTPPSPPSRGEE